MHDTAERFIGTPSCDAGRWLQSPVIAGARPLPPPGRDRRLVVIAPHPDDEILGAGGLVASHLAGGGGVVVVGVTDGEACLGAADDGTRAAIAARRREERLASLCRLGRLDGVVALGAPDGQAARHEDCIANAVAALLRPGDVVVTTWRWDGHPDHEAVARATGRAAARVGGVRLLEAPVWMCHWARPGLSSIDWACLHAFALDDTARERKQAALACHRSQIDRRGEAPPVLDDEILARSRWPLELFFEAHA